MNQYVFKAEAIAPDRLPFTLAPIHLLFDESLTVFQARKLLEIVWSLPNELTDLEITFVKGKLEGSLLEEIDSLHINVRPVKQVPHSIILSSFSSEV